MDRTLKLLGGAWKQFQKPLLTAVALFMVYFLIKLAVAVFKASEDAMGWFVYVVFIGIVFVVVWFGRRAGRRSRSFRNICRQQLEEFGFLNVEVFGEEYINVCFPGYPDKRVFLKLDDSRDKLTFSCSFHGRSEAFTLDETNTAHELQKRPDIHEGMMFVERRGLSTSRA